MAIYIVLLLLIVLSMVTGGGSNSRGTKRGLKWLRVIFIYIYLLCALRASSVGRDVPGYELVYGWTKSVTWDNWNYVYYEAGYLFLMKVCVSLGLSFQWFLAIAYAIIIYPVYLFIKKYSDNYGLSALIFVCFQYLNFDLSGIRQALSMSVVLVAYMLLIESKKLPLLKYILCVMIATTFHKGAYVCFVFVIAYLVKSLTAFYIGTGVGLGALLLIRGQLMVLVRDWFEKDSLDTGAGLYIGTNFIMTFALAVFFIWYLFFLNRRLKEAKRENEISCPSDATSICFLEDEIKINTINVKMYLISFAVMILFGAGNSARSYMFLNQVLLNELPIVVESKMFKSKAILIVIISLVFVLFFVTNVLMSGGFDIIPYKFFWQAY